MIDFLASMLKMANIPFTENEPLAAKSTFRIGGTARLFITPQTPRQFESAVSAVHNAEIPFFVMGGASNIVFPDGTYDGAIISTQNLKEIFFESDDILDDGKARVTCQCGVSMAAFVDFCTKKGLSGAQQFAGLPGTVGGAVYMNARCFDRSVSDILHSTAHFEFDDKKTTLRSSPFTPSEWDYKKSPFSASKNKYILTATFCLEKLPAATATALQEAGTQLEAECKKYIAARREKGHFSAPSAGSVFKNNHAFGAPSGKLIDDCGLKGLQIGGAQIAPFHGNFIINVGGATASDVRALITSAQKAVKQKFGFDLEPEIIFV